MKQQCWEWFNFWNEKDALKQHTPSSVKALHYNQSFIIFLKEYKDIECFQQKIALFNILFKFHAKGLIFDDLFKT